MKPRRVCLRSSRKCFAHRIFRYRASGARRTGPELGALVLYLAPDAALAGAFQNGFDDAICAIAVLEGSHSGRGFGARLTAGSNETVDVPHQVEERIGPRLLMTSGQPGITANVIADERRILLKSLV